ncbi:hypothetical protein CJD36_009920 [Flavipsychrobacter stenotrophus]|uniref:DUF4199 domain-containing protein n=1 Tax=Flavipsychrobacter stenotrophus TaxID=2077091 RepID=A0A2S7SZU2_9BACT|nr:DUF4199 domain-containing protein [Flavipsychrobacter stenotrophus]PQJ12095.1 hypothetical protein CJD36_009920 [Flavipsychrobacter stenotrophus]
MEQKNTHVKWGLISGVLMVGITIALQLGGLDQKSFLGWLAYLPFVVGIILNAMAFSKANDGFVTFKNVFGSGFKASMIVTLLMIVWSVIYIYAFPEMKEKAIEMARAEMAKKPNMTDEAMDMGINIFRKGYTTIIISGALFGTLVMGVIFSLIGAGVAPKKGERPITDNF